MIETSRQKNYRIINLNDTRIAENTDNGAAQATTTKKTKQGKLTPSIAKENLIIFCYGTLHH